MPRPKGTPKTGGRKKGSPSKKSLIVKDFRSRLEENKVNLEKELSKAIVKGNVDMVKALTALMPYLTPRIKEPDSMPPDAPSVEKPGPPPAPINTPAKVPVASLSNAQLLEALKKPNDP